MQAALDALLAHPYYGGHIDENRVAGLGVSAGGATVFAVLGARLMGNLDFSNPRFKAGAGHWPYLSGSLWAGSETRVNRPFLGVSGTLDTNASLEENRQALKRSSAPAYLVALDGESHWVSQGAQIKAVTWTDLFFRAYLLDEPGAAEVLADTGSVSGAKPVDHLKVYREPGP